MRGGEGRAAGRAAPRQRHPRRLVHVRTTYAAKVFIPARTPHAGTCPSVFSSCSVRAHPPHAADMLAPVRCSSKLVTQGTTCISRCRGSTLYIEPEPVVALNNAEARLAAAKEEEEAAILLALSRQVAQWCGLWAAAAVNSSF